MRKIAYFIAFLAVAASLALTIVSQSLPNWIYVSTPPKWPARFEVSYGLYSRCEKSWIPLPGSGNGGYVSHSCTKFPSRTECENGPADKDFCILWHSAGYASQLGADFAIVGLVAILAASLSRARRTSLWKVVALLVWVRAVCQIVGMSIIVHLWRTWDYAPFEGSNLSYSFYINLASWIFDLLISLGVGITGLAAEAGYVWAAGRRAYRRIPDTAI